MSNRKKKSFGFSKKHFYIAFCNLNHSLFHSHVSWFGFIILIRFEKKKYFLIQFNVVSLDGAVLDL